MDVEPARRRSSCPSATIAAKVARLYQPARINNVNVALDPVTGQTLPNIFVGTFVPEDSGDRYNGMVTSDDPNYPKGFRDSQGLEPEPRVGLAWDIDGGKTALHASAGLYHNPHVNANGLDAMARNPPAQNTPSIIYGTMDTLLAVGARARSRIVPARCSASSAMRRRRRATTTPSAFSASLAGERWST